MTYIHPTAIIYPDVRIGKDCYIGPYCLIGFQAQISHDFGQHPEGKVVIGDNVVLKGFCTIDSGTFRPTLIDDGCFLMYYAHVGHDCEIHENVTLSVGVAIGGETTIKADTNVGLGAAIHQQTTIPQRCMIGMNAAVTRKGAMAMKPSKTWGRVPARLIGNKKKWLKG